MKPGILPDHEYPDHQSLRLSMMAQTLGMAVPLAMRALQDRGGPTAGDRASLSAVAKALAESGDQLIFGGPRSRELFNATTRAIAILAFCPGGITIFGLHFEADMPVEEAD